MILYVYNSSKLCLLKTKSKIVTAETVTTKTFAKLPEAIFYFGRYKMECSIICTESLKIKELLLVKGQIKKPKRKGPKLL